MEEDIKNLEEIIELSKEEIDNNNENCTAILDIVDLKSLQNLLKRYKELKENSILISVIKKKIEKYEEFNDNFYPHQPYHKEIEILKEILDERRSTNE